MSDILTSTMNNLHKEVLMNAVIHGTYGDVKNAFNEHKLVFDESYFDYKLLIAALKRNNTEILKYLLYDINCRVVNPCRVVNYYKIKLEETPLHLAMKLNETSITEELLRKGALFEGFKSKCYEAVHPLSINVKHNCKPDDINLILHFHIACISDSDIVAYYLRLRVNPNTPFSAVFKQYCGLSFNPVQFAAEKNYWALFRRLLTYGGDISIKNAKGLTPLHTIYYNNSISIVKKKSEFHCIFYIVKGTRKFANAVDNNGVSHLHMCCMLNRPDFVQKLIGDGANVNSSISLSCPIDSGYTPLHFAVINDCEKVVELLLKNGADCNKQDKKGRTPLHLACKRSGDCKIHIVKLLLDYQADPTIKDKRGCTPLHMEFYFAENRHSLIVLDMLVSKITGKINFTNNEGLSHFHIACTTNKVNLIKDFLEAGVNIDACVAFRTFSGFTALHFAVLNNQKDVVELLLEKNAKVNIKSKMCKVTPLHLACEFNYAKFCVKNANKNIEYYEDRVYKVFPIYKLFPVSVDSISNRRNQLDIISLLLSQGAEVDAKDCQGLTPLLHACMIDRNYCKLKWSCTSFKSYSSTLRRGLEKEINIRLKEIIEELLPHKAKLNDCSNRQESILHIISKYRSLKFSKKFINSILNEDINVDAVDDAGLTPLHVAVHDRNKRMVQILLEHNANVNVRCKNSRIPLHRVFSIFNKRSLRVQNDIMNILLNYGADINIEHSVRNKLSNTCISPLLEWLKYYRTSKLDSDLLEVYRTIYIHVQKLLALNFHVSEKAHKLSCDAYSYYERYMYLYRNLDHNLDNIFHNCTEELERMKLIKINSNISLYNIILLIQDQHELARYAKNKNLIEIIQAENLYKDFPLYSSILKTQVTRASIRSDLFQSAKASLNHIFKASIPDLCLDEILKNLEINDFVNLNKVVPSKMSLKRKSDDTNLIESESLINGNKERKIDD